jgi:hypothetical protein
VAEAVRKKLPRTQTTPRRRLPIFGSSVAFLARWQLDLLAILTYELENNFVAAALGTVQNPNRSGDLTVTHGTLRLPFAANLEIAPTVFR